MLILNENNLLAAAERYWFRFKAIWPERALANARATFVIVASLTSDIARWVAAAVSGLSDPIVGNPAPAVSNETDLKRFIRSCRGALLGIGLITALVNVLYLTGSFFMLEVYDRVIPSRSVPTLVGLCVLALILYGFQGALDAIRGRILSRIGTLLDHRISGKIYGSIVRHSVRHPLNQHSTQPLRDLDQVRSFLSGTGPAALFDLPWMPLYLAICFMFHFWIGAVALVGAVLLISLTILTDARTREPARDMFVHAGKRNALVEASRRNAEALHAMGMTRQLGALWVEANANFIQSQQRMSDVAGTLGALSKVSRMVLQSAVLALGAYLVINQQASAGIIIASSILTSRALAPVEIAIANWKGFVAARQSWRRLSDHNFMARPGQSPLRLPAPRSSLIVEDVSAVVPGQHKLVVQNVNFALQPGNALGIIGPSASGKTSLARLIVGIWPPIRGKIRLDGAALDQWDPEILGAHIGYVPQDVELFSGTIAQNIARFDASPDPNEIIAAAQAAGVHDLVLRLPEGYETQVGESGAALSAGQRQRVALARALYRDPFLVVLDEPNSNLDGEGEQALSLALQKLRARGAIVVIVAHRPSALASVDLVLTMFEGRVRDFGPKDDVLARVFRAVPGGLSRPKSDTVTASKESARAHAIAEVSR